MRRSYSGARSFRCCEKKSDRSSGVRLPVKGVLWRSRVAVSVVLVKNAAISSGVPSRMRSHSRWGAMGSGAWATFRRSAKAFGSSALPADYRTTVIAAGGGGEPFASLVRRPLSGAGSRIRRRSSGTFPRCGKSDRRKSYWSGVFDRPGSHRKVKRCARRRAADTRRGIRSSGHVSDFLFVRSIGHLSTNV